MGLIERILFIQNPDAVALAEEILNLCEVLILPAFLVSIVVEYFRGMNFHKPITKLVIALMGFYFFIPLHTNAVEMSFDYSEDILAKYSDNNSFAKRYDNALEKSGKEEPGFFYKALYAITGATNKIGGILLNLSSYFFLFILKYVYSIIYYLTIILFGVSAIISFLPISEGSLSGHLRASLWCVLMPIVVSFILILIGSSDALTLGSEQIEGGIVNGVLNFLSLLLTSVCILISPIITLKLIDGTGIHAAAETVAKAATFSKITNAVSTRFATQSALNSQALPTSNTGNLSNTTQNTVTQGSNKFRSASDALKGHDPYSHLPFSEAMKLRERDSVSRSNTPAPRQYANSRTPKIEKYTVEDKMLGKSRPNYSGSGHNLMGEPRRKS